MNDKFIRNTLGRWMVWALAATGLLALAPGLFAQTTNRLISWNSSAWRYNDTRTDLGTAWRAYNYVDSAWSMGTGVFQAGEGTAYPAPFNTGLNLGPASDVTPTIYFRIHFNMPANVLVAGMTLWASNLVDDGCLLYINDNLAGSVRVTPGSAYATLATGGPAAEGQIDLIQLSTNGLRVGDNVLAVEVHQSSATSSDIVWDTALTAITPSPVSITSQPQPQTQTVDVGAIVTTATMQIAGGPGAVQWQRDNGSGTFVNVPGQTNATLSFYFIQTNQAGTYRAVVSAANTVISSNVTIVVVPDRTGPRMVSAQVVQPSGTGPTNQVRVVWNERLFSGSVQAQNFVITLAGTTNQIPIIGAPINSPPSPPGILEASTVLTLATTNIWHVNGLSNYFLTVNNIRDFQLNYVAPGTTIGIGWPTVTNLFPAIGNVWRVESTWQDPDVTDTNVTGRPWYDPNYSAPDAHNWVDDISPFYFHGSGTPSTTCFGPFNMNNVNTFAYTPTLLRTWFNWPTNAGSNAVLALSYVMDDGIVIYLNGVEFWRSNVVSGPVTRDIRATADIEVTACHTARATVNNLRPGTSNLLAVALLQAPSGSEGAQMGFAMAANPVTYRTPSVPTPARPRLNLVRTGGGNCFQLNWTGGGFALESVVVPTATRTNFTGPWFEVQPMFNAHTNCPTDPFRIYRLRYKN